MLFSTVTVLFGIYVCWIPQINAECQSKILNVTKIARDLYIYLHAFSLVHLSDHFFYSSFGHFTVLTEH